MPISIGPPSPGAPFGPSFLITAQSSFVGPVLNPHWQFDLAPVGSEGPFLTDVVNVSSPSTIVQRKFLDLVLPAFVPNGWTIGQDMTLRARLIGDAGTVEEETVTVTWDPTTNVVWDMKRKVDQGTGGGGLTVEQSLQLEQAATNTAKTWPGPLGDIIEGVANVLTHPPLGLLTSSFTVGPFSGSGAVPVPEDVNLVFGLYWRFTTIPLELGRTTIGLQFFNQTMVQLRARYTVSTTIGGPTLELYNEVLQANWDQVIWMFKEPLPTEIEFDLLPGVEAEFQWICLRHRTTGP